MAGNTPLHTAVRACNEPVFHSLLGAAGLNLELQNKEGHTALWVALAGADSFDPSSLPALLIQRGANVDAVSSITGWWLSHT
ncbi:ANKFY1 [Cordylochernes scorpioides]|uniref:ANKFY1 n=1 Tax=Cordylochernes scorpioides TaxID=51811 RepID=A0ABY6JXL1_9ARAC|nr:ANKFY1 [Cordylochernes scorpioides]